MKDYYGAAGHITIWGKTYSLYINGPLKKYPYILDDVTMKIPEGKQLPLLRRYFAENGVEPSKNWNTHSMIRKAVQFARRSH